MLYNFFFFLPFIIPKITWGRFYKFYLNISSFHGAICIEPPQTWYENLRGWNRCQYIWGYWLSSYLCRGCSWQLGFSAVKYFYTPKQLVLKKSCNKTLTIFLARPVSRTRNLLIDSRIRWPLDQRGSFSCRFYGM